jgi:MFS family permease
LISALGGLVPGDAFAALVLVRGLLGFGQAVTDPSTASLLADYYTLERRGRAFAIQQCLLYIGLGLGLALGTLIGPIDHGHGWRLAFFVSATPGILTAILVWRLPEPSRGTADRSRVSDTEAVEVSRTKEPLFPEGLGRFVLDMIDGLRGDVRTILDIPTLRFSLVGVSAILFVVTAVATWMPEFYERQLGLHQTPATLDFGAMVVLGGIPGTLIGGRIADRWVNRIAGARMVIPGVCLAVSTTGFIISFLPMPFSAVFAVQLVAFFAATCSVPALRAGLSDTVPAHLRGTGFGAFNLASVVFGSAAAPVATSYVATQFGGNFRTAFLIVMPVAYVGAYLLWVARKHIEPDTAKIFEAVIRAMALEAEREAAAAEHAERHDEAG